jgi:AbrB family looped-hinge helix DNA binding protein
MSPRIDRAGRVVVPKPHRERLGLHPGRRLRIEERDGGVLITPIFAEPRIEETPGGPVIVPAAAEVPAPLTDEMVRDLLETGRP